MSPAACIGVLWVSLGVASVAAASEIGFIASHDGAERIYDFEVAQWLDQLLEDGSKGDGVVNSNIILLGTQCRSGDWADNFNAVSGETGVVQDTVRFTAATVLSGDAPGGYTLAGAYDLTVTQNLNPGWTIGTAHYASIGRTIISRFASDRPFIAGDPNRQIGGGSSTHVLYYAGRPDVNEDEEIANTVANFPETPPGQTLTILAGNAAFMASHPGVDMIATKANLKSAIQTIGALMDDGPDEQFILIIGDHGDAVGQLPGGTVPAASPGPPATPGRQSSLLEVPRRFPAGMALAAATPGTGEAFVELDTAQIPGADFDPADLQVVLSVQPSVGAAIPIAPAAAQVAGTTEQNGVAFNTLRAEFPATAFPNPRETPYSWIEVTLENGGSSALNYEGLRFGGTTGCGFPANYRNALCMAPSEYECDAPGYWPLDETHGAGAGPQPLVNLGSVAQASPFDGAYGFADDASSDIGAEGPRPPQYPGLPDDNRAQHLDPSGDPDRDVFADQVGYSFPGLMLSAFVKRDGASGGTIVSQYDAPADERAFRLGVDASGCLEFGVSADGQNDFREAVVRSGQPLPIGQWSHVAASWNGAAMCVFVDGREAGRRDFGVPMTLHDSAQPIRIGVRGNGEQDGFDGSIDEVGLHAISFTEEDVAGLYNVAAGTGARNIFGLDLASLGEAEIGVAPSRAVRVTGGTGGSDGGTFDVKLADVRGQGFNLALLPTLPSGPGSGACIGAGGKVSGVPRFLGLGCLQQSSPQNSLLVANFFGLSSQVHVRVHDAAGISGECTAGEGTVASLPGTVQARGFGVLPAPGWGYVLNLSTPAAVALSCGPAAIGDRVELIATELAGADLTVSNVDVLPFRGYVDLIAAAIGPLTLPNDFDVNVDGAVDLRDLAEAGARLGQEGGPADLDRSGRATVIDLRAVVSALGLPPSVLASVPGALPLESSATAGAAPDETLLLALQTSSPVVQPGQALALDLVLSGLAGTLGGFALEVRYDPSAFELDGIAFGGPLGNLDSSLDHSIDPGAQTAVFAFDQPGTVELYVISLLDEAQLAPLQQSGTLTLATLDFRALAPAATQFDLAGVDLANAAQPPAGLMPLAEGVQVQVSCAADSDGDSICDADDNCPFYATPNLADTDADGRGDECECTDQNVDGRNTVSDLVAINLAIFNPGLVTPLCDGNNDGQCNVNDILAANVEIFSPTNTSTCARQPVPGP